MIDKLMKFLLDFVYGTKKKAKQYLKDNPTETIIAIDVAKGICTENVQYYDYGNEWENASTATVILTKKKIVFNSPYDNNHWVILIEDITIANLNYFANVFGQFQILKIQTNNGESFQFGMQRNVEWTEQTVLSLKIEKSEYSNIMFFFIWLLSCVSILLIYFVNYLWTHQ